MTEAMKHAALLRDLERQTSYFALLRRELVGRLGSQDGERVNLEMAKDFEDKSKALLACAAALERQGRWRAVHYHGQNYLIPVEKQAEWQRWCDNAEPGEYSAIVPSWAEAVPDNVVITGWEG
jgi:hypothetical protein